MSREDFKVRLVKRSSRREEAPFFPENSMNLLTSAATGPKKFLATAPALTHNYPFGGYPVFD
jgi:hypothetical protein